MAANLTLSGRAPGRNDPCPCGSGRKFKACCAGKAAPVDAAATAETAHERGLTLERAGRIDEAITAYEFAGPGSAEALSRLGHLYLGRGRRAEAGAAWRAAAALTEGPDQALARRMDRVRALMLEEDDAAAEAELKVLLAAAPDDADALWILGRILTQTGRFDEAAQALERAIAHNPSQGSVWYDLVRSRTLGEADRPLVARMLAAAREVSVKDERVKLHFALGKAFDDLGDPAAAMRHFAKANEVKRTIARLDRPALARHVDSLIAAYSSAFLAECAAQGDPSRTPVFVLGMPRSGTTLVEQILSSHPAVAGAGELVFWTARDPILGRGASAAVRRGVQASTAREALEMLGRLAPQDAERPAARVIDKNPFNFFWAGMIHAVFPNAVIVHCRRAAIDTCLSIHSTYFVARTDFSTDADDLVFYWGQYARLMDHWRAVLPADRFVEADYAELIAAPEAVSRGLVGAMGLDWDDACLAPERNGRAVRTSSQWQVRQPINRAGLERWRRYEPWLGGLKALIPKG